MLAHRHQPEQYCGTAWWHSRCKAHPVLQLQPSADGHYCMTHLLLPKTGTNADKAWQHPIASFSCERTPVRPSLPHETSPTNHQQRTCRVLHPSSQGPGTQASYPRPRSPARSVPAAELWLHSYWRQLGHNSGPVTHEGEQLGHQPGGPLLLQPCSRQQAWHSATMSIATVAV